MPHFQGVEVLARTGARAPFVIVSGDPQIEGAAERFGAHAFFTKPFEVAALVDAVERLVYGERTPSRGKDGATGS
jgi:FixJ family two-component response regulator